jgi:uncharacterized protein YecT (DUF1311 family)
MNSIRINPLKHVGFVLAISCVAIGWLSTFAAVSPVQTVSSEDEALRWVEEYKGADAEMNKAYQTLLSSRDSDGAQKLRAAQRAWVVFRDAEAESVREDWNGGRGQNAAVNSALTTLTRNRTRELMERL